MNLKDHKSFLEANFSDTDGLSQKEVTLKQEQFGKNTLTASKKTPLILVFLKQFQDILVLILLGAAIFSFSTGEGVDGAIITLILIINAAIGFFQEYKADKTLEALKSIVKSYVTVLRDGEELRIDTEDVVPGDIILLNEGDKIPADGIVLISNKLKAEESALTGEALPVEKKSLSPETDPGEAHKVFMGTSVVYGSGTIVVTHTGMNTSFGNIARLTQETKEEKTPLQKELDHIGFFVGKATLLITLVLLMVLLSKETPLLEAVIYAIAIAVAAVPEGLPATVSIALALGVERMAKKKAIVKKLSSVETLGATTVICSDKTGTLTQNSMTVQEIFTVDGHEYTFTGEGYNPEKGSISSETEYKNNEQLTWLLKAAYLCNDAHLHEEQGSYSIIGDPTEGALITAFEKAKIHKYMDETSRENTERVSTFPFDSVRKRMSVIVQEGDKNTLYAKGAPEQIIPLCTHVQEGNTLREITESEKQELLKEVEQLSQKALRTLAFAHKHIDNTIPDSMEEAEQGLICSGIVGMMDPPRAEVPEAVSLCKKAGIRIIMITGDYPETAKAIAQKTGIFESEGGRCVTGAELHQMDDNALHTILNTEKHVIFARVAPEDKMRIVGILQEQGEVVAVTGDGVNDAPALKKANMGIAMGIAGTDVSKEAADMVLTDDSFATIVNAVEEGRTIYTNLKKFVWFIFSCNIGELVLIAFAIVLGFPLPLTALLILLINLGTDVFPALALGIEPSYNDLMNDPPRDPKKRIMTKPFVVHFIWMGFWIGGVTFIFYAWECIKLGYFQNPELFEEGLVNHNLVMTESFVTIVILQLVNALNAKHEKRSLFSVGLFSNPYLLWAILASLTLVMVVVYVPFVQQFLHTEPLHAWEWFVVVLASTSVFIVEEVRKIIIKRQEA